MIILIFAISIKFYVLYRESDKRLYFAVFLFKNVKLFSGFICKRESGGLYLHLKNKAYILTLKSIDFKSGSGIVKAISVKVLNLVISASSDKIVAVYLSQALLNALKSVFVNMKSENKSLDLFADLNVYFNQSNLFNIGALVKVRTSLLRIIFVLILNYINKARKNIEKLKN